MPLEWKKKLPEKHTPYVKAVMNSDLDIQDLVQFVMAEKQRLEKSVVDHVLQNDKYSAQEVQSLFNYVRSYTTCKPFSQFIPSKDPKKLSTWSVRECRLLPLCPWCRIKLITRCHIWQNNLNNKRSNFVQINTDSVDIHGKLDRTIKKLRNESIENTLIWLDCATDNLKTINILTPKTTKITRTIDSICPNQTFKLVDNITHNNIVDRLSEFVKWDKDHLSYPQNFIDVYNLWKNRSVLHKIKVSVKFPKCLVST